MSRRDRKRDDYVMPMARDGAELPVTMLRRWVELEALDLINDEAEMALLGACLHNNRALDRVIGFLKGEHFGNRVHQRIYEAMLALRERDMIADPITLKTYFENDADLAEIGGYAYLMRLAGSVASILNAEDYGQQVLDLYLRRAGIVTAASLLERLTDPEVATEAPDQLRAAEHALAELAQTTDTERGVRSYASIAKEFGAELDAAAKGQAPIIECGMPDLDRLLGLRRGHQLLLAGATSMGKTALAGSMAYNIARYIQKHDTGEVLVYFSFEMKAVEMFARHVAPLVNISADAMLGEMLDMHHYERIIEGANRVGELPIFMLDRRGMTTREVRAELRKIARKHRIRAGIFDHLGLLRHTNGKLEERLKVRDHAVETREMAEEFDMATIALCQLKRFDRPNMRPTLDDLKETSDLEQTADTVGFVFREEYYLAKKQPTEGTESHVTWQLAMDKAANMAELNVAKRRMGPLGRALLHFDGPTCRFTARSFA